MDTTIILIGPICAGKSSVAECLAERLALPTVSMDGVRTSYYAEIGYDAELARRKRQEEGWWAQYRYWKPFEAHAVARILEDHPIGVIDLGAGHSVYEDEGLFERVAAVLAPYRYVILLLPSPDPEQSLRILSGRCDAARQLADVNRHFLEHHSNYDLAKFIVYTADKTPAQVCEDIVTLIDTDDVGVRRSG